MALDARVAMASGAGRAILMPRPIPVEYEVRDCLIAAADGDGPELRAVAPLADTPGFDGYVTTWWTVDDRGTFFVPGSATKTVKERRDKAPVLWQHWPDDPIGRHNDGTRADKDGLRVSVEVIESVRRGEEAMSLLRAGVPLGLSFGFTRIRDRSAEDDDPLDLSVAPEFVKKLPRSDLRGITEFRWWESSIVTFPANERAQPTAIRSADPLTTLLAAIRAGTLDDEQRALAEQIVAAMTLDAAAGEPHGTSEARARRDFAREFAYLAVELGIPPEVAA
jgi:HK97 family phage prohead protease